MATVTLKLNEADLKEMYRKAAQIERNLTNKTGDVYKYVFKIGDGYRQAVLSGIGQTTTGVMSLKQFLGTVKQTRWEKNAGITKQYKAKMGWSLEIWKASGAVENVMNDPYKSIFIDKSSTGIDMFSGIDGRQWAEAFDHAYKTEYGGVGQPFSPHNSYDGRALFTLLNVILKQNVHVIMKGLNDAVRQAIVKSGWGA